MHAVVLDRQYLRTIDRTDTCSASPRSAFLAPAELLFGFIVTPRIVLSTWFMILSVRVRFQYVDRDTERRTLRLRQLSPLLRYAHETVHAAVYSLAAGEIAADVGARPVC